MGAKHTFFENNAVLQLLLPQALTGDISSTAINTGLGRANALSISVGTFTFTGTNFLTLTLEDSDDNSSWDAVVNGANLGEEINVRWSNQDANELLDDTTTPATTTVNAALVLDEAAAEETNYIAEYLGSREFVRMTVVEDGTVTAIIGINGCQGALKVVPRFDLLGDNN